MNDTTNPFRDNNNFGADNNKKIEAFLISKFISITVCYGTPELASRLKFHK